MSEHAEQRILFEWAQMFEGRYPELALLFAVPNGGYRAISTAKKLKLEGVKSGVPDVWLPVPRGHYCGLIIEMKFGKNMVEVNQKTWLTALAFAGWSCHVCYCFEAARMALLWYLSQQGHNIHTEKIHFWKTEDDFNLTPTPEKNFR